MLHMNWSYTAMQCIEKNNNILMLSKKVPLRHNRGKMGVSRTHIHGHLIFFSLERNLTPRMNNM